MTPFFKPSDCDGMTFLGESTISLAKANRLHAEWLAKGRVVYGQADAGDRDGFWGFSEKQHGDDTHRALLINIEPLEVDSERKVLEDLVEWHKGVEDVVYSGWGAPSLSPLIDRARKLLEKK